MPVSEAQKRAQNKYNREKVHPFSVKFYPAEEELWQKLGTFDNRSGFVKDAIRDRITVDGEPSGEMGIEEVALFLAHCEPGSEKFDSAAKIMARKLDGYAAMQGSFEG